MFVQTFGKERIGVVLADREFIGKTWITYLQTHAIAFCIRLKEDGQCVQTQRGRWLKPSRIFQHLQCGQSCVLGVKRVGKTRPVKVHVSVHRNTEGRLLVVMHSQQVSDPIGTYALRWQIECMFKAMKSSGFHLEETHLTHPDRIETLLGVVAIAFCYAYDWGLREPPLPLKSHGSPQHSVFRLGLDALAQAFRLPSIFASKLRRFLRKLLSLNHDFSQDHLMKTL